MKKKQYMEPCLRVVEIQQKTHLLQASKVERVSTDGIDDEEEDELEVSKLGGGSSVWDR